MKKTLGILVILILTFSIAVFAGGVKPCTADDPPDLTEAYQQALSYLANSQNPDGSWGTLPERDTILAADALISSVDSYSYEENLDLAFSCISQLSGKNTDIISRKAFYLGFASQEEWDFLAASRNPDGGFALAPGLPSTPLDTSISFRGLLVNSNIEEIRGVLSFLYDAQSNGAYPLYPGGPPDLLATTSVAKALNITNFLAQNSEFSELENAKLQEKTRAVDAYLTSVQHPDGGFGEQGSTAYETALVLEATSWSTSSSIDVMEAASFLLDRQQADGSISGDVATTAMFCTAAGAKPYLPTSALTFDPDSIPENSPLKGSIKIGNMGLLPTGSFELSVALDDPGNTIASLTVEDVPPCGQMTLPFEISLPATRGKHDMYVSIASGFNKDTNFYDNYVTGSFNVEAGCNFALTSAVNSPEIPLSSKYFELQVCVRNTGEKGAGPIGVSFYEGSSLIGATSVTWLGANEEATAILPDVIMAGGDHAITAVLDEAGDYSETNEADNRLDFAVSVAYDVTIPELASPEDGIGLDTKTPTLSWYPSTGADNISYILELSNDPGAAYWSRFDGIPQAVDLVSFQWPYPLNEGTVWWRVRATDGLKETDPSRTRAFTIDTMPPQVTLAPAEMITFSPNSDGLLDQAQLQVGLNERANIVVEITDADGLYVKSLCDGMSVEAGKLDLTWNGTDEIGNTLEGVFKARVTATDSVGNTASYDSPALISDVTPPELVDLNCAPDLFSPNGDGRLDGATIHALPTEDCELSISLINHDGRNVGQVCGPVRVASAVFDYAWDGRVGGYPRADGAYTMEVRLVDDAGNSNVSSIPVTLDTSPPTISCPNVTLETTEVRVGIISSGAQTVTAHFRGETLELVQENGVYEGSFTRPAEAGSYPMYVVTEDAAANATISDTVAVLISSMNFTHSWIQTTLADFRAGEEKNGTDVETSPGAVTLAQAQGPTAIAPPIRQYRGGLPYGFHQANAIVGADGRIYMAGGKTTTDWEPFETWHNTMYIYDPATDSYSYGANMNSHGGITCSVMGTDGKIYCFNPFYRALTNTVEAYDPVTNNWEMKNPLPYNLGLEAGALGPDGCIYLFGGWIHWIESEPGVPSERTDAVLRYNPATGDCTQVNVMPNDERRCCFYAVSLNDKIYLMGGHTDTEEICNTVWEYDAITNTFTSCPDVPPSYDNQYIAYSFGRVPVACPLNDSIYFIGASESWMSKVQRYNPSSRNWTDAPDVLIGAEHRVIACIDDKLYIFGGHLDSGYSQNSLNCAEVYTVGYNPEGYFVSSKRPLLNGGVSVGDIMLSGVLPPGTSAAVSMRCSSDGSNWSDWSEEILAPGGTPALPASNVVYVQYRLRLLAENNSNTPVISEVSVSYNSSPYDCQFKIDPWGGRINPVGTIGDNTPTLRWWMCQDADNDPLTATLELDRVPSMDSPERRAYSGLPAPVPYVNAAQFTIPDDQPLADGVWYYRVRCYDGMSYGRPVQPETFTVETTLPNLVSSFSSPDPFSPDADGVDDSWNLAASCDKPADGTLKLYDDQGNLIKTLTDSTQVFSTGLSFNWDGKDSANNSCPPGRYAWELSLNDSLGNTSSPYKGTVDIFYPNGSPWQLVLAGPVAEPSSLILTDSGGDLPSTAITFAIDDPATVSAAIYKRDGTGASTIKTFYSQEPLEAGEYTLTWDGMKDSTTCVRSGEYEFEVSAVNGSGSEVAGSATIQVERVDAIYEGISLSDGRISPNGDGVLDSATFSFTLTQAANVMVEVKKDGVAVKELAGSAFQLPGVYSYDWDGTDAAGNICADGEYRFIVDAKTRLGMEDWSLIMCSIDTQPPELKTCLLDRVPGYPDRFILTACFDDTPASSMLLTGGHSISLTPAGENSMVAEITTADLAVPDSLAIRVSDDLGNTTDYGFTAHLPASVSPYEKLITSQEDFERGALQGVDAQTYPDFLATNAAINPDWLQLGYSPVSFPNNTNACTVGGVTYMFGYQTSDGQGGFIYPVWAYDTPTDTWSIVAYAPANFSYSAAAVLSGKIYLAGTLSLTMNILSPEVWCFDPTTATFTAETTLPQILLYHTAVSHEGYLYVLGGWTIGTNESGNQALVNNSRVYRYDPATHIWEDFCSAPPCVQFSMTEFMSGSMFIRAISTGDGIYVFNAAQTEEQMFDTSPRPIFCFDPAQASFDTVGESALTPGLALDPAGRIYLLGQCEKQPNISQNNWTMRIFDTSSGQMSEGSALPYNNGFNMSAFDQSGIRLFGAGYSSAGVYAFKYDSQGHFTSEVIDLGGQCRLGMLSWLATCGPGAEISCVIRTSEDRVTWSDWSEGSQDNMDLTGLQARYVQVRADFPKSIGLSTTLAELRLGYENNGTVFTPDSPDLRVDGISFEPASPEVGEDVQIRVAFSNQGAPAISPVLRLYQGADQVGPDIVPLMLTPGASQESTFTYKAAEDGSIPFIAVVDPDGAIVESNDDNNILSAVLDVQPSGIQVSVSTDKASYLAEEDVSVSCTVRNDSDRNRYPNLEFYIEDASGNYVEYLGYEYLDSLTPGEERTFTSSWNTGFFYSGDYRVWAVVVEDGFEKAAATAPFAIEPQGSLTLGATCDRISYAAGDVADLRARLISEALNFRFSGLTVRAEVLSPEGSIVYSSDLPSSDLYPGDLADVPYAFEVADSPAGTYTFRATVFDGDEDIASAEASFEVESTTASGTGVSGSLSAVPQVLEQGAPFTLDYTLANQGNDDLAALPVWLLVVDPQTGDAVDSRELSIGLALGASAQGTEAFSSEGLASAEGGKNYLTILVAQFEGGAKTLGFTALKVTPPALDHFEASPVGGQVAGVPFQVEVRALSAYGIDVPYAGTLSFADTSGTLSPSQGEMVGGVFTGTFTITKATGADVISVNVGGINVTSNSFEVIPGPADHLIVEPVSSPQQAGTSFSLTACAWDAYNNPVVSFNEACTITDATGTITPATSAFAGGQMSAQVVISQALLSDIITISAGGIYTISNPFEVKATVDIDISISVEDQTAVPSILVWTDTDANETMITEVLTASGYNYTIVRADHSKGCGHAHHKAGMEDFAAEMRSGLYNVFLLLSPDHPLDGHLADEVREMVNAGAGLLLSDPKDINHFKEHPAKGGVIDLFGVKEKGSLPSGTYTASLAESPLSPAATLDFAGKMKKLEIDDAQTLGTVTIVKGNKTEIWPALTLKQYGRGKASLIAFDFAQVSQAYREKAKTILNRALSALCAPGCQPDAGSLLPLRIDLINHGPAAQIKVEVALPAGASYLWAESGVLDQGKVVFTLSLTQDEQRQLYLLLVPQQTGTLSFTANLFYQQQGSYVFLKDASTPVTITGDAPALQADVLTAINTLIVANKDRHNKEHAYGKVEGIDLTEQDLHEIDEDIEDLTKAVEDLQKISSADTTQVRLLLDRLLIQLQMSWYSVSGGGN